jgi:hypothetical protein
LRNLTFCLLVCFTLAAVASSQTTTEPKILTAADFNEGRREGATNDFWLQIHPQHSPLHLRLTVAQGSGRIEISPSRQTLSIKTQLDASNFVRLFTVVDVNFDGYLDLAAVTAAGAQWGRLHCWIYEPKTRRYVTSALTRELALLTHNGIAANAATKELIVSQFPPATPRPGTLSETYQIANGHLLLVKREFIRETRAGLEVVTLARVNNKLKIVATQKLP